MGNAFQPGGGLYFNDLIVPTDYVNVARVTNVMTRFPNSAVSVQIIPTAFTENERLYFSTRQNRCELCHRSGSNYAGYAAGRSLYRFGRKGF